MGMNIFIIDKEMHDKIGHCYEYDKCVSGEITARWHSVKIYCSQNADLDLVSELGAEPLFSNKVWTHSIKPVIIAYFAGMILINLSFFKELITIRPNKYNSRDVLFFPTFSNYELLGILLWYRNIPEIDRPFLLLLFRVPAHLGMPNFPFAGRFILKRIFRRLNHYGPEKVRYLTDSPLLADEYKNLSDREVTVLPIPHLPEMPDHHSWKREEERVTFTYLGRFRTEKGAGLLMEAIRKVHEKHPSSRFLIQISPVTQEEDVRKTAVILSGIPCVEIVPEGLSTERYHEILERSDCVLIPYDPSRYLGRTSGIFAEALALGKPVISTENTWMALNIRKYNECGIVMEKYDSESLAEAMEEYILHYEKYDRNAEEASVVWRRDHGVKRYVDILLGLVVSRTDKEMGAPVE
jgi:glycosyltransferase involved in cell wall biosynthesis